MSQDVSRLPQWAQREIARLQANLARADERMCAALGTAATNVEIDPFRKYLEARGRTYVPDETTVQWQIPGGKIDIRMSDGAVEITGSSDQHDCMMVIVPHVSNMVSVRFAPRALPTQPTEKDRG